MEKLIAGALRFQNEVYPSQRQLYEQLASGQSPHTLLITCSDSRLVPGILLQAGPGEIFVCRNAGNIVPAHGYLGGISASIEYAVQVLRVQHIVVCGHSDCGAMKAVLHPENLSGLPAVAHWMRYAERARAVALEAAGGAGEDELVERVIHENVLAQLDHLRTLPCVAARLASGTLQLHGWVFDIRHGRFRVWDSAQRQWRPLEAQAGAGAGARQATRASTTKERG